MIGLMRLSLQPAFGARVARMIGYDGKAPAMETSVVDVRRASGDRFVGVGLCKASVAAQQAEQGQVTDFLLLTPDEQQLLASGFTADMAQDDRSAAIDDRKRQMEVQARQWELVLLPIHGAGNIASYDFAQVELHPFTAGDLT
ncbi:MAG: hypothetical protein KC475_08315 [Cyanobacteria bacterium HKST-UBA03]|nr:hypothetical protein [Cyanobacteria bacterium HKST-UBA03]